MTLIVEIEDFLREAQRRLVDASGNGAVVVIRLPRPSTDQGDAAGLDADDDDDADDDGLITWEDAAWQ